MRLYPGKEKAHIYDVIVLPSILNKAFAQIEFRRYFEYSRLALNKDILVDKLERLMSDYDLSYDDIKFAFLLVPTRFACFLSRRSCQCSLFDT